MLGDFKQFVHKHGERLIAGSHRLGTRFRKGGASGWIGNEYVSTFPDPQNALDIFAGEWWSKLPSTFSDNKAGHMGLADDPRLHWMFSQLGSLQGFKVLELGPLEGAHTYMLQQAGAASIVAIEANVRSYLKCLIMKETLKLDRASFLCGDFMAFLRQSKDAFDLCLASGVLYHMVEPAELIALASQRSNRLFLWTHYYDDCVLNNPRLAPQFSRAAPREYEGFCYTPYRQGYGRSLWAKNFSGGQAQYSHWMTREDILRCLTFFGYEKIEIALENEDGPSGPNFSVLATKSGNRGTAHQ